MKVKFLILDDNTLIDLAGTGLEVVKAVARDPQLDAPKACATEPTKEVAVEAAAPVTTAPAAAPAPAVSFRNLRFFTLYEGAEVAFTLGSKIYQSQYDANRNSRKDGFITVLELNFDDAFSQVQGRGSEREADDIRYFAWNGLAFEKGGFEEAIDARTKHPNAVVIAVGVTDEAVTFVKQA